MTSPTPPAPGAIHDFDFLVGTWTTQQRRLKRRLQGCQDWETFEATSTVQRLPGGMANFDTLVAETWRPGWVGMSLRVFNPTTQLWSIYWIDNGGGGIDANSGRLEPPVTGRFNGDEGIFEGDDVCDGQAVRVRFRWTRQSPDAARWEQMFSADAGSSWEVNWVMEFQRTQVPPGAPIETPPATHFDSEVVELRQYTLHPGKRERLIELFDRELVETQEAQGLAVMGQFRDLDAPDRFVWLRGFASRDSRPSCLASFYDGPTWQRHRDLANATMIDSDDVLLLRPAWPGAGIAMHGRQRATAAVRASPAGLLDVSIFHLHEPASAALLRLCRDTVAPLLTRGGATVLGCYVNDEAPNNFPRLPVRQGEQVLVVFAMFPTLAAFETCAHGGLRARELDPALEPWLARPTQCLRLVATARSAIHA